MTFRLMILCWLPVSLALWGGAITAGVDFWNGCLALGAEACAEGSR